MVSIEEVQNRVMNGTDIEDILNEIDWHEFETFVANIFEKNDFIVKQNFRFKTEKRYEIDLIAIRNNVVFCVDCKQWRRGRHKSSAICKASEKQNKRIEEMKIFLIENKLNELKIDVDKTKFISLIVTLFQEDIEIVENIFITPTWKLNQFLNSEIF